jgi:hypothetical protein
MSEMINEYVYNDDDPSLFGYIYKSTDFQAWSSNPCNSEVLHSYNSTSIPEHRLILTFGTPVKLIRDIPKGSYKIYPTQADDEFGPLISGTSMWICGLDDDVIRGKITDGIHAGKIAYLPRYRFVSYSPVTFMRVQFPIVIVPPLWDHFEAYIDRPVRDPSFFFNKKKSRTDNRQT